MSAELLKTLRDCSFFSEVNENSLKNLADMAVKKKFAKGEIIFKQGQPVPGIFVIATGMVRVFNMAPNGKEHVLHLLGPGETFLEVAALGDFPCPAFGEAIEKTACVLLPAAPFNHALKADHRLCLQILAGMGMWIKHFVGLLEGIVLRDAAGRVAAYLLQAARGTERTVSLPSLKKHIASHLNLTSETLSRTLRQLREDGLIEEEPGHRLRIRDREGLRDLAEGFLPVSPQRRE